MNTIWMASVARAGGIETDPADWLQRPARSSSHNGYRYQPGVFAAVQRFTMSRIAAVRRNRARSVIAGLDAGTLEDIGVVRGRALEMRRPANANPPPCRRTA